MDVLYRNAYLDAAFGVDHTADFPATVYLALFLQTGAEVAGGAYARLGVPNNAANFGNAVNGEKSNVLALAFAVATASWGTIYTHKWMDAASGGLVIHTGALLTPTLIDAGMTANFPAGTVIVTAAAA